MLQKARLLPLFAIRELRATAALHFKKPGFSTMPDLKRLTSFY
jgi:hypothetical protein